MKLAIILSLLAIGYLIYWNSRRVAERYKLIVARAAEHVRIEGLMQQFGQSRERLAEIKEAYAARFGGPADLDLVWPAVTRSVELAGENLKKFQFDLAVHFMGEALHHAETAFNRMEREQAGTAGDGAVALDGDDAFQGDAGLREIRQCIQVALDRRG